VDPLRLATSRGCTIRSLHPPCPAFALVPTLSIVRPRPVSLLTFLIVTAASSALAQPAIPAIGDRAAAWVAMTPEFASGLVAAIHAVSE